MSEQKKMLLVTKTPHKLTRRETMIKAWAEAAGYAVTVEDANFEKVTGFDAYAAIFNDIDRRERQQ